MWDETVFTKNRERLLEGDIVRGFLQAVPIDPTLEQFFSTEYFSVDGTLIEALASMKSFRPKEGGHEPPRPGRNGESDFYEEQWSNATRASPAVPMPGGKRPSSATWATC